MNDLKISIPLKEQIDCNSYLNNSSYDQASTKLSLNETNLLLKNDMGTITVEKDVILNKEEYIGTNYEIKYEERRRIGNMFAFWYKNGEPIILIGPHWPFFLCLSSFISFICFIYFYSMWDMLNFYFKVIGIGLYITQLISYILTALINPGFPKKEMNLKYMVKNVPFKNFRICGVCNVIMNIDESTSHCEDCNICIEGHDHHCPWTTKCVGKGNLKYFYSFVTMTFVLMGFLFFGLAISSN